MTPAVRRALGAGAWSAPFSGHGWDGDSHWTPELVRAWWRGRADQEPPITSLVSGFTGPRPELPTEFADLLVRCLPIGGYRDRERARMRRIVHEHLDYRQTAMKQDLQRYVFFLEQGHYSMAADTLPSL